MKAKAVFLLILLALGAGCRRSRPSLVPEISPPLVQEEVFTWEGRMAGDIIFPCPGGIGWVDASGWVVTWNAGKKTAGRAIGLPFKVGAPPFRQGDLLVLGNEGADDLLVLDLRDMKIRFELHDVKIERVLAVDRKCLIYLDAGDLIVYSWADPAGIYRFPAQGRKFFNCEFFPDRILILEREILITFWRKTGRFATEPLPQPAASPFTCDGRHVVYGSTQRYLVDYSLSRHKPAWKLKLGQVLERPPFAFAGAIVATPADHNVMQVNKNGSILWWQALRSTMSFDLLPMSEHLAAVLLNREIKFINLEKRVVTVFKGTGHPVSRPVEFDHDLYFMMRDGDKYKLQRVGNLYGIKVESSPAKAVWAGQAVQFSIQPYNLVEPAFSCVILDPGGRIVFSKSEETSGAFSLVWIPVGAGSYKFKVTAAARNRGAETEIPVQVLDAQSLLPGFYLHF